MVVEEKGRKRGEKEGGTEEEGGGGPRSKKAPMFITSSPGSPTHHFVRQSQPVKKEKSWGGRKGEGR